MSATAPIIWTRRHFQSQTGGTGVFSPSRGLLASVDEALHEWERGQTQGSPRWLLLRILTRCRGWIAAKQGKGTNLANRRRIAVQAVSAQTFARLQFEFFKYNKTRGPNQNLRGLQGGYQHERSTYETSKKTTALSGSSVQVILKNAQQMKIDSPPNFNNMTDFQFKKIIDEFARPYNLFSAEVRFFTKQERMSRLIVPIDGLLYREAQVPLSTDGEWAWAMDRYGNLFSTDHHAEERKLEITQRFNHSTFNAGHDVVCAGVLSADRGRLTTINNSSGHYKPRRGDLHKALLELMDFGYDFRTNVCAVHVLETGNNGMQFAVYDNAMTFIRNLNAQPDSVITE